jgi:hypothetical protein
MVGFVRSHVLYLCAILSISCICSATAQADPVSSGSAVISAEIKPVRYVLIDNNGDILQIESNTPRNVAPLIYKDKYTSPPKPVTKSIETQYQAILAKVNTNNTGVIYSKLEKTKLSPSHSVSIFSTGFIINWHKPYLH